MNIEKCVNFFTIIVIILCCKFKFNCNTCKKRQMKINIGVRAVVTRERDETREAAPPPPKKKKIGQLRFFGQQEKIWAKPVFTDVLIFFLLVSRYKYFLF